jgi:predicted transcriptional regulator of viral defense system/very-short-patch-repair endonuclease
VPKFDRLHAVASRQYGLVTLVQLAECGLEQQAVSRMVKAGKLERVRLGVYRLCGVPPSWRATALAAVLAVGGDAVLSHRSAAALWGLIDHHDLDVIEITGPRQCRQDGVRCHRRPLRDQERTVRGAIPVTTAARTLADVAEHVDAVRLGRMVDEALRRRITTLSELHSVANGGSGRRRLARAGSTLRTVLADRGVGYDPGANDWEQEMDRLWEEWGLPEAKRQYRIRVGGRSYRVDRAIVSRRVAIEWNGRAYHGTRSAFEYDSDRRNRLQAAGWRILDFHYRSDPELIVRTVLAVCEDQHKLLSGTTET